MSSYRERLQGNWFYHYQSADTAGVRDKRVKKLSTFTLSINPHLFLDPLIPPLSLSLFVFFFLWPVSSSSHQITIFVVFTQLLLCAKYVNIDLHTLLLCFNLNCDLSYSLKGNYIHQP